MEPDTLVEDLIRDEGVRNKPYKDSVGKTTIGVGRNLDDVGLSDDEVEYLLRNDIARTRADLEHHLPWVKNLDIVRYNVLMNMAFNMGADTPGKGLLSFRNTLRYVRNGEWEKAAQGILNSKYAKQVGVRADRLAAKMREGR